MKEKAVLLRPILKRKSKEMNKISYALGLGIGQQLKSMGIKDFSVEDFTRSICDVLTGSEPAISHREAQTLLNEYFDKQARSQAEGAIAEGKAFLEENAKKEGVITTKSGLQYQVLDRRCSADEGGGQVSFLHPVSARLRRARSRQQHTSIFNVNLRCGTHKSALS